MYDTYGYSYDYGAATAATGLIGGFLLFMWLISLTVSVFGIVCMWKVLKKAGKQGWECLIPVYNIVVMLEVAELPTWYVILFFLPIAHIYATFKLSIELAHKFGKSTGFGIGLVFLSLIFYAILAFDKKTVYQGATPAPEAKSQPTAGASFCPSCGTKVDSETVFCANCGNRLK